MRTESPARSRSLAFDPPTDADHAAFAARAARSIDLVLAEQRRVVRRMIVKHGETAIAIFFAECRVVRTGVDHELPFAMRVARGLVRERLRAWLTSRGLTSVTPATSLYALVGLSEIELAKNASVVVSLDERRARRSA